MSFESLEKQPTETDFHFKGQEQTYVDFDLRVDLRENGNESAGDLTEFDPDRRVEMNKDFESYSDFELDYDPDRRVNIDKSNHIENHIERTDLSYEQKVEKQNQEISDVETGVKNFDRTNTHETGNYGEMIVDQDLRSKGYERLSNDMVTDIDETGHQGIDGVYYNPDGIPQYIIVDAKYGSAQLNPDTKDGKQMSENWIDKRLDQAVGKEKADEIRMEKLLNPDNVGTYVAHVDKIGIVRYDKLDDGANVVEKDVKINA